MISSEVSKSKLRSVSRDTILRVESPPQVGQSEEWAAIVKTKIEKKGTEIFFMLVILVGEISFE